MSALFTTADVAAFDATGLSPESEKRIRRVLARMVGLTIWECQHVMYEGVYPAARRSRQS